MKKYTLLIIAFIFIFSLKAQNTFFLELNSNYSFITSKIVSINNKYYLIGNLSDKNTNVNPIIDFTTILFKIKPDGQIIDSFSWPVENKNVFFNDIFLVGENIGIIGSIEIDNNPGFYSVFYLTITENLEILTLTFYDFNIGPMDYTFSFINNFGNISIAGVVEGSPPNMGFQYWNKLLFEITPDGTLTYDTIFNHGSFEMVFDFIPFPETDYYLLYCSQGFTKNRTGEFNVFDSNYNLISASYSPDQANSRTIRFTEDNDLLISARLIEEGNDSVFWLPTIRKLDSQFSEKGFIILGYNDSLAFPSIYNSLSTHNKYDFFSAYTYNYDPMELYSPNNSYIMLHSFDKNLNVYWQQLYGGDAYYRVYDLFATDDGGCIITATKYSHGESNVLKNRLVIMKVDENGLITSTDESPIPVKNAIVTPNPGKEYLQLHSGIYPAVFQLFNMGGQLVLEQKINQNTTTIPTQSLSAGTYIWQLLKDGKVVESDKWLKE